MAAPVVQDADTTTGTQSSSSVTWSFTYPSNIAAGDLLIAFFMSSASTTISGIPSGWVQIAASIAGIGVIKKKATGSETGSVNVTWSVTGTGHWVVYRITGWDSNIGASFTPTFSIANGSGGIVSDIQTGTSTTPDPISVTSSWWDSGDDSLAIAIGGTITNQTFSAFPSGYTDTYSVNDANGGSLALARKTITSNTENPGTFTIGSSVAWAAGTILIHGANGGPLIQDADSQDGVQTSNSSSWTLTYPGNIASGDLILILVAADGAGANAASASGFTDVNSVGATASVQCLAKIAAGTETGTFTLTMNGSEQGTWVTMRVTNWYGSGLPSGDNAHDGAGVDSAQQTETTNANPNPPNLDPANWATETSLWLAVAGNDGTPTTTAWPFTSRDYGRSSGGAGGANLMFCTSVQTVSSLDPGTFTISASEQWSAITIAIRPAAVAAFIQLKRAPLNLQQAVNRAGTF